MRNRKNTSLDNNKHSFLQCESKLNTTKTVNIVEAYLLFTC